MADSKWSERKEEHLESKTKSCKPKRKTSEVDRSFQESAWKSFETTDKPIQKNNNSQVDVKLGQFMEKEIDAEIE